MHNNSIPISTSLKPAAERVVTYYVGTSSDISRDYDAQAVGFPSPPRRRPVAYARSLVRHASGLTNAGHDEGIFVTDGRKRADG
jgi:hypothetical protein